MASDCATETTVPLNRYWRTPLICNPVVMNFEVDDLLDHADEWNSSFTKS